MRRIAIIVWILLFCVSCLKEDELKKPFVTYLPKQLNDGWLVSTPEAENIDAEALTEIFQDYHTDNQLWQVRSLLVFRNGNLVAESYTKDDEDQQTPRAIWSATKQVMGLLTGIALEEKLIDDIAEPISNYLPEVASHPDKNAITIEHLLTMKSGIAYSNDGLSGQTDDILRQLPDRITEFILSLPLVSSPGSTVQYKDGDPQLVASVIQQAAGVPTSQWAKEVLFDKLEIQNLVWDHYKDGVTLGGFGILTTPRELSKVGQCVLDSGRWKGSQVVSKVWIEQMTTPRVTDMYGSQFGYLWWMDPIRGMTFMSGHGGQYVFILPAKQLVITMTSEVNTQGEFQFTRNKAFAWVDRIAAITH